MIVIKATGANRTLCMTPTQPKYETTVVHSLNNRSTSNSHILHLVIAGQELALEGPHGCDYVFAGDAAYRCLRHRWLPGSEASYLQYASGSEMAGEDEDSTEAPTPSTPAPLPADSATFDENDIPF